MNEEDTKKAQEFLKEYGELVKKHNMDFASYPMFVPDGQGGFKIIVQNTPVPLDKMSKPSPFMGK